VRDVLDGWVVASIQFDESCGCFHRDITDTQELAHVQVLSRKRFQNLVVYVQIDRLLDANARRQLISNWKASEQHIG
jgi:hypothetical protein